MTRWIVDGMNLIGSKPNGWWRDRPGARRRLLESLEHHIALVQESVREEPQCRDTWMVVFDGRDVATERAAASKMGITVSFAPGGPNAADDVIVDVVRHDPVPRDITVVTSDRPLADAVQKLGADVLGVGAFARQIERLPS